MYCSIIVRLLTDSNFSAFSACRTTRSLNQAVFKILSSFDLSYCPPLIPSPSFKKEAIKNHRNVPNYNLFINVYVLDRAVVVEVVSKLTKNRVDMFLEQARGNTK